MSCAAEVPVVQPDLARTDRAGQECRLDTNAVRRIPILFEGPTAKSVTNCVLPVRPLPNNNSLTSMAATE